MSNAAANTANTTANSDGKSSESSAATNPIAPAVVVPQNPPSVPAMVPPVSAGVVYDISSLDPLQAHALQLTASAGLNAGLLTGHRSSSALPPIATTTTTTTTTGRISQPMDATANITTGGSINPAIILSHAQQQQQTLPLHQQLFLLQPQSQQQQTTASNAVPATLGASNVQSQPPSVHTLIAPAGGTAIPRSLLLPAVNAAGGTHAALSATLASQAAATKGYAQLLAAQGLLPQQYLDIAAAAVNATTLGVSPPSQGQPFTTSQSFPPFAPATLAIPNNSDNNNKREIDAQGSDTNSAAKKQRHLPPSTVSSSNGTHFATNTIPAATTSSASAIWGPDPLPPKEASEADLAKMTPAERRRYERNLREQQRSYRISQQIKELRDILVDSKFPFKPNKYSILLSVAEYIKQLQSRAIMLDTEHSKLIKTIRETNDMVNAGTTPTSTDESVNATSTVESGSESEMLFVRGIDYRSVFDQCPAALGIAALDGRILECNMEFQTVLGFPRPEDVLKQSLFNLVQNHQDIFRAMAQMLKTAEEPTHGTQSQEQNHNYDCFNGTNHRSANENMATGNTETSASGGATIPVGMVAISKDRFWAGPVTSKLNVNVRYVVCPKKAITFLVDCSHFLISLCI
jgi:PAS domain-containing protein